MTRKKTRATRLISSSPRRRWRDELRGRGPGALRQGRMGTVPGRPPHALPPRPAPRGRLYTVRDLGALLASDKVFIRLVELVNPTHTYASGNHMEPVFAPEQFVPIKRTKTDISVIHISARSSVPNVKCRNA